MTTFGYLVGILVYLTACAPGLSASSRPIPTVPPIASPTSKHFDGTHAYQEYLIAQMNFGPRPAGSNADRATGDYILGQLSASSVVTSTQNFTYLGAPIRNIIGKLAVGKGPVIVIGAHYDTRVIADQDKQNPKASMPGADDGASGVSVLLELARTLNVQRLHNEVWLAFFDAEDNGNLDGCTLLGVDKSTDACDKTIWPFSVGASYLAANLAVKPEAVVVLDMIGDANQDIYYEQNSDKEVEAQIWQVAADLGYSKQFIPEFKWPMEDDHTPFLQRGIRAVDIIDFDYPYWHTTQDTADKVSPESLGRVGLVVQTWLEGN